MNEKNTKATETVEIDPGMSVMPEGPGLMDVPTVIPELDSMLAEMYSALPAYQATAWKNKPSTETPIDADAMTRIEQRLVDLTNAVNGLQDSVSQCVLAPGASSSIIDYSEVHDNFVINMSKRFTGPSGTEYKSVNIIFENNGCRVSACRADNGEWGPIA